MIPDYQSLMLPLLKIASDGAEHRISDVTGLLAKKLNLTDAEAAEMLEQLTTLMMRHNVGVRVAETLHLKKVDEDFFGEE
jgi:restriction system protein